MGATEILVSGGVAAILAAVAGGGLKAFGVEMPLLASMKRQILVLAVGVGLIALGLFAGRPPAATGGASAQGQSPGNGAAVQAPAPAERAAASVVPDIPNIVEMPFPAARRFLMNNGWTPIYPASGPMANSDLGLRGEEIFNSGFTEAVSCSGTGRAPCLLRYVNPRGYVLEVVAVGETLEQGIVNSVRVLDCFAEPKPEGC